MITDKIPFCARGTVRVAETIVRTGFPGAHRSVSTPKAPMPTHSEPRWPTAAHWGVWTPPRIMVHRQMPGRSGTPLSPKYEIVNPDPSGTIAR